MLDNPDYIGSYSVLEVEGEKKGQSPENESGVQLMQETVTEAREELVQSSCRIIIAVLRAHLVELLENNREALERKLGGRLNVRGSIDKIVTSFMNDIKAVAHSIVQESSGASVKVDASLHAEKYTKATLTRLGLGRGEAA